MESPADEAPNVGRVHRLNVSDGGVPKWSVPEAEVGALGITTDRQAHRRFHGGPQRAVCLLALEVIERLRREGHPIAPGTVGENVTVAGIDWAVVRTGDRFRFAGGVELQVTSGAVPCRTIRASFRDGRFGRIHPARHPGEARLYTRVLQTGRIRQGEAVEHVARAPR